MATQSHNDDPVLFAAEQDKDSSLPQESGAVWRVLIVDDDKDVHRATAFALSETRILGRRLEFLSAYSATEARAMLARETEFACILLDVVMETECAGLELVGYVRNELKDDRVQIVLRTGQPGYAPEMSVIRDYDINDYRSKNELTHTRLVTMLTGAIRAYNQLCAIDAGRRGLELLFEGATELVREREISRFCRGVLRQLETVVGRKRGSMLGRELTNAADRWEVLAAAGSMARLRGREVDMFSEPELVTHIRHVRTDSHDATEAVPLVLPLRSPSGEQLVLIIDLDEPLDDLGRRLLKLFALNITVGYDNARMFERVERLAYHDELTGTANRAALEELMAALISRGVEFALLVIDIDDFQTVNDGLGRESGDRTLCILAEMLREYFGSKARIARVSGDGFAVLLAGMPEEEAGSRFDALGRRLADGIRLDDYEIPLTVTGGLVLYPDHGQGVNELNHNAGIALKHGKRRARSTLCRFTRDFELELQRRLQVARDLRAGIGNGELHVLYQPRVTLSDQRVTGVEALIRWRRAEALVRPAEFLDAAEDSGLIVEVGRYVLEEACRQQLRWRDHHGIDLTVAVNVSMRQLRDVDFLNVVDETLAVTGIDPAHVEFEMTESLMMEDTGMVQRILAELRHRGTQIAVDDFGTGYSSLSYLQKLPLDRVKIDQSFVTGVDRNKEDQIIVSMIINMSHLLDLQVVAEGVETPEQHAQLERLGCDECQGHYYSEPLSEVRIPAFVRQFRRR